MLDLLKNKRIIVTGGAGFIGSHIVDALVKLGAKVTVVDNLLTGNPDNIKHNLDKITFIERDFAADEVLNSLADFDYICHQAALRSVPKSVEAPFDYHHVNVTGTLKLFLKAKEADIKRIVFASSSSVYGERFDFPEKEVDLPKPISPYAASKLMCETYAYIFTQIYNLEVVGLRYFNVFGPRQSLDNEYAVVVPKFINCLLNNESPPIYGDGEQERDFTYIDNVVNANLCALVVSDIGGEVFNVASANAQSVNTLFSNLQEIIKSNVSPTYSEIRLGDVKKTEADIEKSKNILKWEPKIDFYQGLEKTVAWFKANN